MTFDAPAIRGEQISIYGTGFGPYSTTIVDGFFVPATPATNVSDPVILNVGAVAKTPDFAGAAPGFVGMTLVQMTITDDLPATATVNLTVTVGAKQSTTVVLAAAIGSAGALTCLCGAGSQQARSSIDKSRLKRRLQA